MLTCPKGYHDLDYRMPLISQVKAFLVDYVYLANYIYGNAL